MKYNDMGQFIFSARSPKRLFGSAFPANVNRLPTQRSEGPTFMVSSRILVSLATLTILLCLDMHYAYADNDFIVYSPTVVIGESEIEIYSFDFLDGRGNLNTSNGSNISLAHTFTNWWKAEVYVGEFNRDPGGSTHLSGYEFDNTFQLTAPGEYWATIGFLASYNFNKQSGIANSFSFGPILEKQSGHIEQRLNMFWQRPIGSGGTGSNQFLTSYSVSYKFSLGEATYLPGIEAYYRPDENSNLIGPVLYGEFRTDAGTELEYSVGLVFGISQGAPDKALLGRLEYNFF